VRISVLADPWSATVDEMLDEVRWAGRSGIETYWIAQIWRMDSMTLIPSLAAAAGPDLKFGSSIVNCYLRHPVTLASQALTTNLLVQGRFTLGVGPSAKSMMEGMFDMPFEQPLRYMSEYLDILVPGLDQQPVDTHGATSYHGAVDVPGAPRPALMLAALGPKMLQMCGARTDGTITWLTGPKTLAGYVVPTIRDAAATVNAADPRVVALVPVLVTDDVAAGRQRASEQLDIYAINPGYNRMIQHEGWSVPSDAAIVGNEEHVRGELARYDQDGVTEVGVQILGPRRDHERTRALLAKLTRSA
jgi:5,10-methylenetetrahydromethanopterin reductase